MEGSSRTVSRFLIVAGLGLGFVVTLLDLLMVGRWRGGIYAPIASARFLFLTPVLALICAAILVVVLRIGRGGRFLLIAALLSFLLLIVPVTRIQGRAYDTAFRQVSVENPFAPPSFGLWRSGRFGKVLPGILLTVSGLLLGWREGW